MFLLFYADCKKRSDASVDKRWIGAANRNENTKKKGNTMIRMKTSLGDITIELDEKNAPITCANFMKYVESGHFNLN